MLEIQREFEKRVGSGQREVSRVKPKNTARYDLWVARNKQIGTVGDSSNLRVAGAEKLSIARGVRCSGSAKRQEYG